MNNSRKTYQQIIGDRPDFNLSFTDVALASKIKEAYDVIIVLDDDPTGTQTVHDIPVLTEWTSDAIAKELENETSLFYILTNSRSLTADESRALTLQIAHAIKETSDKLEKKCLVISRSDSTLRGHYPSEVAALSEVFQTYNNIQFLVPAFFEGGRYTINNIHYVREGDEMIPAGETPFAQDKVFGYASSNLINWVREKHNDYNNNLQVYTLSIRTLETNSTSQIASLINRFPPNSICIINATNYNHLKQAIYSICSSKASPYFRSAASLIAALAIQSPKIVDASKINLRNDVGGLTIVGSYVPKSTSQLSYVLDNSAIKPIEIDVQLLLHGTCESASSIASQIDTHLLDGQDVIVYTSRQLISSEETERNLDIGANISNYLTAIVGALEVTPRYIIGKGGITSSDLATKSLNIKRAIVLGQIIPGVPVWQSSEGSKFPNIPFIIFPGNVGNASGLSQVIQKLQPQNNQL